MYSTACKYRKNNSIIKTIKKSRFSVFSIPITIKKSIFQVSSISIDIKDLSDIYDSIKDLGLFISKS
jgi:hypothetical protein